MRKLYRVASALAVVATLVISIAPRPAVAAPVRAGTRYVPGAITLRSMLVSAANPRAIYVFGSRTAGLGYIDQYLARSTDSGATWTDLSDPTGLYQRDVTRSGIYVSRLDLPILGADGQHLYATAAFSGSTPASGSRQIHVSVDSGLTWTINDGNAQNDCGAVQYGAGPFAVYASPVNPNRIYALGGCGGDVNGALQGFVSSSDAGNTWIDTAQTPGPIIQVPYGGGRPAGGIAAIVPDPARADTVFVNVTGDTGGLAGRSDNAGVTWTTVTTPTDTPAITSYAVSLDPREPGMLEAHATDSGRSPATIYLSADHGQSWRKTLCPGALRGACPTFTLANAFGAGHNYAVFGDGVHAFDGNGSSGPRLALSDQLPGTFKQIADVQGGTHAGDPVYLLTDKGVLYRSADSGTSWQRLNADLCPTALSPNLTAGSLAVPHARYPVAAPFVKTFRKLGLFLLGLPLTGAYYEGAVLTQDFEHMRLEVRKRNVILGNIGTLVQAVEMDISNNCTDCYDVKGDFLKFWRAHGGKAVFGLPISDPYAGKNGDGSNRIYTMQLFEHARLELHPEIRNPAYHVELGLLGSQYLVDIGWLRTR